MNLRPALLLMLLTTALGSVQAQSVWRCGADGKQFSDKPCEQGRPLETLEARPHADLAAAQSAASREKALAAQMAKERQERESKATLAAGISNSRAAQSPPKPKATEKVLKKSAKRRQPAEDGTWRAVAPSSRQTKG